MTDSFCTLFNRKYLARGLSLYESIKATTRDFHLYILCIDDQTFKALQNLNLQRVTLIRMKDFESAELLKVKPSRTLAEYCWTCTSSLIEFCLNRFSLETVTYIDADIFFFQSPRVILSEFEASGASVMITEHRYTPKYDLSEKSGIYCVQFMTFKNDSRGQKVLKWWREQCLAWCYNRFEDGKFGDQKYLDDWTTRFEGIHVLDHLGGGVAPWNVQQYEVRSSTSTENGALGAPTVNGVPIIFYHFHNLKILGETRVDLCRTFYELNTDVRSVIYRPYVKVLMDAFKKLRQLQPDSYDLFVESKKGQILGLLRRLRRKYYVVNLS